MISPPAVPSRQRNSTRYLPNPRRSAQALVTVDIIGRPQSENYISADFVASGRRSSRPFCLDRGIVAVAWNFRGLRQAARFETEGGLLDPGEREDTGDIIARLPIRRDAVELLHRAFAGVIGGQREIDRPEAIQQRLE